MTGAEINLKITNQDNQKQYVYDKTSGGLHINRAEPSRPRSSQISKRLKANNVDEQDNAIQHDEKGTQTSNPAQRVDKSSIGIQTEAVPTKDPGLTPAAQIGQRIRCRICNGVSDALWLGCTNRSCKYWVHAKCIGLIVSKGERLSGVKFYCPTHIANKSG